MEEPIKYALSGIQILSKSLSQMPPTGMPNEIFHIDITEEDKVQAVSKSVLAFVFVNIYDAEKSKLWGHINTVTFFTVEDFDNVIKLQEDGKYKIPSHLEMHIKSVAISTTRGIMYSEFRGTHLHNAIMPVVMVHTMQPIELTEEQKQIVNP